jgi:hypothetical protein
MFRDKEFIMSQMAKMEKRFNDVMFDMRRQTHASKLPPMLALALKVAMPTDINDPRSYLLGTIGERSDGATVFSKNGAVFSTTAENYQRIPSSHAEVRTVAKMDHGGVLYVGRISRILLTSKSPELVGSMARPCPICQKFIKAKKISKVFYTIDHNHYGIFYPKTNSDKIFNI